MSSNRIARKNAQPLAEVFKQMICESHVSATHNSHRIFAAWNEASGAGNYTIKRYFRDGKLYITLSSSVICNQLMLNRDGILQRMNEILAGDELFITKGEEGPAVKQLILR